MILGFPKIGVYPPNRVGFYVPFFQASSCWGTPIDGKLHRILQDERTGELVEHAQVIKSGIAWNLG